MIRDIDKAVRLLYPSTSYITYDSNEIPSAFDTNENPITLDLTAVNNQAAIFASQDVLLNCKSKAQSLLQATDWVEIPSVSNTANQHHLINVADFITYRIAIRALAVNPVANPTFPTLPIEQWSS